jgi:ammonia channel protein AmtB
MYVKEKIFSIVLKQKFRVSFSAISKPARHLKRRVFLSTVNSIIAGMVAVAGGAVAYNPWSAVVVGAIAALSFLIWSKLLLKLQVDDPVETAAGKLKILFHHID